MCVCVHRDVHKGGMVAIYKSLALLFIFVIHQVEFLVVPDRCVKKFNSIICNHGYILKVLLTGFHILKIFVRAMGYKHLLLGAHAVISLLVCGCGGGGRG